MKKADNFDAKQWLVENKITFQSRLNEEKTFDDNAKAYGILFLDNDDEDEIEETPYIWNEKALVDLVKSMGYTAPSIVAGVFMDDNDPEDLTIGMYKKLIEKEFPEKEGGEDEEEQSREKPNPELKKLIEKNKDSLIAKFGLDKDNVKVIDYTYYDYVGIASPYGGGKAVQFSETPFTDGDESGEMKIGGKTIYYSVFK